MATSDATTVPQKYQLSEREALDWLVATICFCAVYLAMMFWGTWLKDYVDHQTQREISTTLTFLLIFTMVLEAKELIPALIILGRQIHYEIYIWPAEHEREFQELLVREAEERKQKYLADFKKKEERRRKKLKPVGEPINLAEWVNKPTYWRGGYIYILKDIQISGLYKIGKTRNPVERMKAFGVQLPFAVELIHVIKCYSADEVERRLHSRFASKRERGEWFALSDEDVAGLKLIHEVAQ